MIREFRSLSYGSSVENLPPVGKTIAVIEVPVPGLCIGFIGGRTILVDVGIIALTMRPGVVPAEGHTFRHSALERKQHAVRSEEHTSELQSLAYLVCRLLLEKKKNRNSDISIWNETYSNRDE